MGSGPGISSGCSIRCSRKAHTPYYRIKRVDEIRNVSAPNTQTGDLKKKKSSWRDPLDDREFRIDLLNQFYQGLVPFLGLKTQNGVFPLRLFDSVEYTIPYARLLEQNTEKSNCCPKSWKQIENAFICSVNGRWPIILGIIMKIWE